MLKFNTGLAAAVAAIAISTAAPASAGELIAAYVNTVGPAGTGVRFLNPDFSVAGDSFATPGLANGLATGANSIFGAFTADHSLHRYSVAGTPQITELVNADSTQGPLAFGANKVFQAYSAGATSAVSAYNPDLTNAGLFFTVDSPVTGLAFGDNSLFVSFGATLQRRDLFGTILQSNTFSGIFESYALGSLAYGDGKLFMGYDRTVSMGSPDHRLGYLDPNHLTFNDSFAVADQVRGLAYGDGVLFASFEDNLRSYDAAGNQTGHLKTAIMGLGSYNGALAYLPDRTCQARVCDTPTRGAVPEPTTWALLILGFGAAGAALRASRRRQAALSAA